jgi:hypothetical protein
VTAVPTNTKTQTPPETHSETTDAPTVGLDGTNAADDGEIDDHVITGGIRSWHRIGPQRLAVFVSLRYILRMPVLKDADTDDILRLVTPLIRTLLHPQADT